VKESFRKHSELRPPIAEVTWRNEIVLFERSLAI